MGFLVGAIRAHMISGMSNKHGGQMVGRGVDRGFRVVVLVSLIHMYQPQAAFPRHPQARGWRITSRSRFNIGISHPKLGLTTLPRAVHVAHPEPFLSKLHRKNIPSRPLSQSVLFRSWTLLWWRDAPMSGTGTVVHVAHAACGICLVHLPEPRI